MCKAETFKIKQHQSYQCHSKYPTVETVAIATAAKNMSTVGLKNSAGGPINSLGTVRGFPATDIYLILLLATKA
jgi:hypothetical protein